MSTTFCFVDLATRLGEVCLFLCCVPIYTFSVFHNCVQNFDWKLQSPRRLLSLQLLVRFSLFALSLTTTILLLLEWRPIFTTTAPWSFTWLLATSIVSTVYSFACVGHLLTHLYLVTAKGGCFPNALGAFLTLVDALLILLSVVGVYITVSFISPPQQEGQKTGLYETVGAAAEGLVTGGRRGEWVRVLLGLEVGRAVGLLLACMLGAVLNGRREKGLRMAGQKELVVPLRRVPRRGGRVKVSLDSLAPEFGAQFANVLVEEEGKEGDIV